MKTLGKLLLLLSFIVVGRWSRPATPAVVTTLHELMAPVAVRAPEGSRMVLVHHTQAADAQPQAANASVLPLF